MTFELTEVILMAVVWCCITVVVFMLALLRIKAKLMQEAEERFIPVSQQQQITYPNAKRLALQLIKARYTGRQLFHQYASEFPHHSAKYLGQVFSPNNAMESPMAIAMIIENLEGQRYTIVEDAA